MSRDLGRDVPGSEKLYARKLWADLLLPTGGPCTGGKMINTHLILPMSYNGPTSPPPSHPFWLLSMLYTCLLSCTL